MSSRNSRGRGLPTRTSFQATPDQCHLSVQQTPLTTDDPKHTDWRGTADGVKIEMRFGPTRVSDGRMDRGLLQSSPSAHQPRQPQPRRLRSPSHHCRDRGMVSTPKPSGKPGSAPDHSFVIRSGGPANGQVGGGFHAPPTCAVLSFSGRCRRSRPCWSG